jgi:hypothetical protein
VHVTLRVRPEVWNLRSHRSFRVIEEALRAVGARPGFAVVHFSVQGNHLHLLVEAAGPRALAGGVRALSIRIARGLNGMMARSGPVMADRYHAHVLRTPAEVTNALRYVLGNYRHHALRRGERPREGLADPYSSGGVLDVGLQRSLWVERPASAPGTWLLRRAAQLEEQGRAVPRRDARVLPAHSAR